MTTALAADARLWWISPMAWDDVYASVVIRPTERAAVTNVRRQARREWPALVRAIAALDRWYAANAQQIASVVRVDLIARRLGCTKWQVRDALDEADAMLCEE